MKKRILNLIIGLIVISLLGIISVQYYWIRNAIRIKEAQFNRSVNEALTEAVNKLETREDIVYMRNNMMGDSIRTLVQAFSNDSVLSLNAKLDSLLSKDEMDIPPPPPPPPGSYSSSNGNNQEFTFNYQWNEGYVDAGALGPEGQQFTLVVPDEFSEYFLEYKNVEGVKLFDSLVRQYQTENFIIRPGELNQAPGVLKDEFLHQKKPRSGPRNKVESGNNTRIIVHSSTNKVAGSHVIFRNDMRKITKKAKKIKDVIHKMAIELESKPANIRDRIDKDNLQNILKKSLADKNINLPFEFSIVSPLSKTEPIPIKSPAFKNEYLSTPHRVSLFPNDIFQKPERLLVYFPGQKNILLRSLSWLILGSILFTLIIAITSILSIFIMLRQKKISDIKTDFINNMTHEFKTPLATISIAVDSINNPKVIAEPAVIKSYTRVIKEENNRMNARVEQILQMALLDSSEFKLNVAEVDLNLMAEKVCNHFRLQMESRNGKLELLKHAEKSIVKADETHLANVLINLLDNANKYSPNIPDIRVETKNLVNRIVLSVEDQGIGMSPDTKHKIFEKFFRVTSGNIHNVKGFGLGLSYSKAIVLAHKGEINVTSEPGKGTTFEIVLPIVEPDVS